MENRGGARRGAGRKSKGEVVSLNIKVKPEIKKKLQQMAVIKRKSITATLEDIILES